MIQIEVTPPQLHELICGLARGRSRIQQRLRHAEAKIDSPEDMARQEEDPGRRIYLQSLIDLRRERIRQVDELICALEKIKTQY